MKMEKVVHHGIVEGSVIAPSSKSEIIRNLACAVFAHGKTVISNLNFCDDVKTALNILKTFGLQIKVLDKKLIIDNKGNDVFNDNRTINCGESATCLRIFSAISLLNKKVTKLKLEGTLQKREVFTPDYLNTFNLEYIEESKQINVRGGNFKSDYKLDCKFTSQFLSGLLIALPNVKSEKNFSIEAVNLNSRPYVDLTIDVLNKFGVGIIEEVKNLFIIASDQEFNPVEISAEGDWSSAANLLVSGVLAGKVKVSDLNFNSLQADKAIIDILKFCGADINKSGNDITISKTKVLKPFNYNISESPDIFPILCVLACSCEGESIISGIERLKYKESSRAEIMTNELKKMGADISLSKDIIEIRRCKLTGCIVNSHNDHRIAMALVVAAVVADGGTKILNSGCVSKSYPEFWEDFDSLLH